MRHSLTSGVCKSCPEELNFVEVAEASEIGKGSWVLVGSELTHDSRSSRSDYPLDLDGLQTGARLGVMVKRNGDLHFSLNGTDMGCAAKGVPSG